MIALLVTFIESISSLLHCGHNKAVLEPHLLPPPSLDEQFSSNRPCHLIVLVHGYLGSPTELSYLEWQLRQQSKSNVVVYASQCNANCTTDGVAAGGHRLAQEIQDLVDQYTVATISWVGNSLGGIYVRHALSQLDLKSTVPVLVCTTATPHLGIGPGYAYYSLPRLILRIIAQLLGRTVVDLMGFSTVLEELINDEHVQALRRYRLRWLYANAHGTDFQVPTVTAGLLEGSVEHSLVHDEDDDKVDMMDMMVGQWQTAPLPPSDTATSPADILNACGWTKTFWDVRRHVTGVVHANYRALPLGTSPASLRSTLARGWALIPSGHTLLVANSKNPAYSRMNRAGQPIMDHLAREICEAMDEYDAGTYLDV